MGGYYGNPWLHQSDINKIHSEQAFQDKRTELKSNIANLTAKYSTLRSRMQRGTGMIPRNRCA